MSRFVIDLELSPQLLARLYRGELRAVRAQDRDGRWVHFPMTALRRFVGPNGVRGTFEITLDDENRISEVKRL